MKLNRDFYDRDARVVGEDLIGKILARRYGDTLIKLRIVETEAYIGAIDKASHGYGGKVTPGPRLCTDLPALLMFILFTACIIA